MTLNEAPAGRGLGPGLLRRHRQRQRRLRAAGPLRRPTPSAYAAAFEATERGDFIDAQMQTAEVQDTLAAGLPVASAR